MNNKDDSKICIMIVPYTKKVKRLLIPQWLPKAALILSITLTAALFTYLGSVYKSNENLWNEYNKKVALIETLEEENKSIDLELATFKSQNERLLQKTSEVDEQMTKIENLQNRLQSMANIESPSRGGNLSRDVNPNTLSSEEGMDVLKEVLVDKELELVYFIEDLESKFEYLECVPDLMPASGRLTSKFGNRRDPFTRRIKFHQGIDIANARGTSIKSSGKGIVISSGYMPAYGRTVIIDHGHGYKSLYAHNHQLLVKVGDTVEKGDIISKMGNTGRSTGSHLHFEIHKNDKPVNPYDILN